MRKHVSRGRSTVNTPIGSWCRSGSTKRKRGVDAVGEFRSMPSSEQTKLGGACVSSGSGSSLILDFVAGAGVDRSLVVTCAWLYTLLATLLWRRTGLFLGGCFAGVL